MFPYQRAPSRADGAVGGAIARDDLLLLVVVESEY